MKNLNRLVTGMASLLLCGLLLTACQSEDFGSPNAQAKGTGTITLDLNTASGFETTTKVVDETLYTNKNNYTVVLEKSNGDEIESTLYSNFPTPYTLDLGSYTVRAYYGADYKDVKATQAGFYVVGEQTFTLDVNDNNEVESKKVSLTCVPTHAKVQATFSDDMSTYFSDYYVTYTFGNTTTSKVDNTDPWYLLVAEAGQEVTATIHLTVNDDKYTTESTTITKTKTLKPNELWTLELEPTYEQKTGSLGITITIDETTEDKEIVITVPSDWA